MSISKFLPMTAISSLGTCRRCMRISFAFAGGSVAVFGVASTIMGRSGVSTALGVVALGFSLLWVAHLAAFAWRSTVFRQTAPDRVEPSERRRFFAQFSKAFAFAAVATALPLRRALAQNCIGPGETCILNGTPCCAGYSCRGRFPNTTCQ
ncbi:MAG: hypothetical protein ACYCOU_14875 [Sulfobacillus sp.]